MRDYTDIIQWMLLASCPFCGSLAYKFPHMYNCINSTMCRKESIVIFSTNEALERCFRPLDKADAGTVD